MLFSIGFYIKLYVGLASNTFGNKIRILEITSQSYLLNPILLKTVRKLSTLYIEQVFISK